MMVDKQEHYTMWKMEPKDFIIKNKFGFNRGNMIKYAMRYWFKQASDMTRADSAMIDLRKLKTYARFEYEAVKADVYAEEIQDIVDHVLYRGFGHEWEVSPQEFIHVNSLNNTTRGRLITLISGYMTEAEDGEDYDDVKRNTLETLTEIQKLCDDATYALLPI